MMTKNRKIDFLWHCIAESIAYSIIIILKFICKRLSEVQVVEKQWIRRSGFLRSLKNFEFISFYWNVSTNIQ